jgi:hypothetical protein
MGIKARALCLNFCVLFLWIAALRLSVVSAQTANISFEFFLVGSGNAQPASITGTTDEQDSLSALICDEFGKGDSAEEVARKVGLSSSELQSHVDALAHDQLLLPGPHDSYTPTFPIIHRGDAAYFTDLDNPLIEATVGAIESRKQELTTRFRDHLHLDQAQTTQLSLVLFGDVLFDRWQTGHVRKEFLLGYPPSRNGLQFYVTALEKVSGKIGSLGIYTHAEQRYGDMTLVTYGHTRILDPFTQEKPSDVLGILGTYVALVNGKSAATPELERLGFVRAGKPVISVISQSEYAKLPAITSIFTPDLLRLMNADRPKIVAAYKASRYAANVSFQEYALWWYHFFDAAVVERLIDDGVITVPDVGYATLVVVPDPSAGTSSPHSASQADNH